MGEYVRGVVGVEDIEGHRCSLHLALFDQLLNLSQFLDVSAVSGLDVVVVKEVIMGVKDWTGSAQPLEVFVVLQVTSVFDGELFLDDVAVVHNDVI